MVKILGDRKNCVRHLNKNILKYFLVGQAELQIIQFQNHA